MGLVADRLRERAQELLGVAVVDKEELGVLRESAAAFDSFRDDASELAMLALDSFAGRSDRTRPGERNYYSRQSRIALRQDPLAGAETDLLTSFAFGKGIAVPNASDDVLQEVIQEAWTDPVNESKLTGFEAQRYRSAQLKTDANLYAAAFVSGGRVRLAFLNPDRVVEVICDPDDDERPLWYAYSEPRKPVWNFAMNRWMLPGEGGRAQAGQSPEQGTLVTGDPWLSDPLGSIVYYPHWRNVEDVRKERAVAGLPALDEPPPERLRAGLVEHVRINRIGRTPFGTPPWERTRRFMSALNEVIEAHTRMAKAASQFIAKRVVQGSPSAVTKAANAVLAQTGELGAARFSGPEGPGVGFPMRAPTPGSWLVENQQSTLESLQLKSGSAEAGQSATMLRSPIAAATGFGLHYLGEPGKTNLATATSLELPTLAVVGAWQQTFAQLLGWFTDVAIQSALRAGRLGGEKTVPADGATPLSELHVSEAEERADAEARTGRSLKYTLSMPYPGRRNLPDVSAAVTTVATVFDATAQNVPMRRALLLWFATFGLQVDDPTAWVDDVLPEEAADAVARAALGASEQAKASQAAQAALTQSQIDQAAAGGGALPPRQGDPSAGPSGEAPKGAKGVQEALRALGAETAGLFEAAVVDPLLRANGHR